MKVRLEIYYGPGTDCDFSFLEGDRPADLWIPEEGDQIIIMYGEKGVPYQVAAREHIIYTSPQKDDVQLRIQIFLEPRPGYDDGSELMAVSNWDDTLQRRRSSKRKN